jgi:hypothetical protein
MIFGVGAVGGNELEKVIRVMMIGHKCKRETFGVSRKW